MSFHGIAPFPERITGKIVETSAYVYGENGCSMADCGGIFPPRLAERIATRQRPLREILRIPTER